MGAEAGHGEISACRLRELQLVRGDIDRGNLQAHRLGTYWIATWPSPPTPEITTHSPGRASVSFNLL
jgi:hypothetical protein